MTGMASPAAAPDGAAVLDLVNVKKYFPVRSGSLVRAFLDRDNTWVRAVDDVSFSIAAGETVGVVGESGCGKTTLGRLVLHDLRPTGGAVRFRGADVNQMTGPERRALQRSIAAVFQDPFSSLNPRHRVKSIVMEPVVIHNTLPKAQRRQRLADLLRVVGLPVASG